MDIEKSIFKNFVITKGTLFYRYNDHNFFDDSSKIILSSIPVKRITPKGVWLNYYGQEKFVLLSARKKFANLTKKDAWIAFKARKNRQRWILEGQLSHIKRIEALAKEVVLDEEGTPDISKARTTAVTYTVDLNF